MSRSTRAPFVIATLAAGLCLTGCGSKVDLGSISAEGALSDGLGLDLSSDLSQPSGSGSGSVAANGQPLAPDAASANGSGAAATGTPSSAPGNSGSAGQSGAANGPGTNGTAPSGAATAASSTAPILVGMTYAKDAGAGLAAIGIDGTFGDQKHYLEIVTADLNAHGGLKGRKVQPILFGYDVNPGSASLQQQDQAACALFTQDNRVEMAWTNFAGDVLVSCLQRKGVPMLDGASGSGYGKDFYAANPLYFSPSSMNLDRRSVELTKALKRQGYFNPWNSKQGNAKSSQAVKVGILAYDMPSQVAPTKSSLVPAIQSLGLGTPLVKYIAPHDSYGNLVAMQGQIQGAVLNFKAAGVTHVLLSDDNGVMTLFFMTNAASQSYKPRYGISSGNNMVTVSQLVGKEQLVGSTGIGWTPLQDLDGENEAKRYSWAGRAACNALMKSKGEEGKKYNEGFALAYCASASFAKARYAAASSTSASSFASAMEATGSSFQPLVTPSAFIGPGRHDGLAAVYDYTYSTSCSCMVYSSKAIALAH